MEIVTLPIERQSLFMELPDIDTTRLEFILSQI